MKKVLKDIFLDKLIYRLLIHYFVLLIIYILILSIVAFFHFLLDHDLKVIERWIFDKQWILLSFSKLSALFIFWNYFREDKYQPISKKTLVQTFKENFFPLRREVMVLITFFLLFFILVGSPITLVEYEVYYLKIFTSYISTVLLYFTDLLIVLQGNKVEKKYSIWTIILIALMFSFSNSLIYLFSGEVNIILFLNFLVCLILGIKRKFNWGGPFLFMALNTALIDSLFGLDFIWKDSFSLFKMTKDLNTESIFVAYIIGFGYIFYKNKSRFTIKLKQIAMN